MLINDDGLTPTHGELVICDMCGKPYKYFIWAMGSDQHLCRKCVHKRPMSYLDDIDAIDIEREHDIIHDEIAEQDNRDFPRDNRSKPMKRNISMTKFAINKMHKDIDIKTIARFIKKEGSAVDVTGLG